MHKLNIILFYFPHLQNWRSSPPAKQKKTLAAQTGFCYFLRKTRLGAHSQVKFAGNSVDSTGTDLWIFYIICFRNANWQIDWYWFVSILIRNFISQSGNRFFFSDNLLIRRGNILFCSFPDWVWVGLGRKHKHFPVNQSRITA